MNRQRIIPIALIAWIPAALFAQSTAATPPDFSGVYYPTMRPPGGGPSPNAAPRQGPPPKPTQSAPLSDGSQGRSPNAPSLTPEYLAKWEMMRKSRISGSYEFDNNAKCLPHHFPFISEEH